LAGSILVSSVSSSPGSRMTGRAMGCMVSDSACSTLQCNHSETVRSAQEVANTAKVGAQPQGNAARTTQRVPRRAGLFKSMLRQLRQQKGAKQWTQVKVSKGQAAHEPFNPTRQQQQPATHCATMRWPLYVTASPSANCCSRDKSSCKTQPNSK
jgi:hypothetical protein